MTTYGRKTGQTTAVVKGGVADGSQIVVESMKPKTPGELTTIACLVGATTITYVGLIAQKKAVTIKPLIGMFVAGSLLLLVSMWSDEVAAAFAIILLVTAIVVNGEALFKAIGVVTK